MLKLQYIYLESYEITHFAKWPVYKLMQRKFL